MSELFTQNLGNQGIQIPAGTIVNGVPFEKYAELRKRIAELEEELKALKPHPIEGVNRTINPSIPDWIAPGKWVELIDYSEKTYYALIKKVEGETVVYKKVIWEEKGKDKFQGQDSLYHVKTGKPFTPPPCPELFPLYKLESDGRIKDCYAGFSRTLDQWIYFHEGHEQQKLFIAIRDWREKWGEES